MKVSWYVWENNSPLEVKKKILFFAFRAIVYTYLTDKMVNMENIYFLHYVKSWS